MWRDIGMALHSSGLPHARALFDEWSMELGACKLPTQYGGQDKLWDSLRHGYNGPKITVGTLFYHARHTRLDRPQALATITQTSATHSAS